LPKKNKDSLILDWALVEVLLTLPFRGKVLLNGRKSVQLYSSCIPYVRDSTQLNEVFLKTF
jgi:hypothetical protein